MTGDNRRRNIAEEVARAEEPLRAAHALRDLGVYADRISRAYCAVFHVLRALILSRDIGPKTHAGAIHLFNQEFVRTGVVASSHNRLLGGLRRARELGGPRRRGRLLGRRRDGGVRGRDGVSRRDARAARPRGLARPDALNDPPAISPSTDGLADGPARPRSNRRGPRAKVHARGRTRPRRRVSWRRRRPVPTPDSRRMTP